MGLSGVNTPTLGSQREHTPTLAPGHSWTHWNDLWSLISQMRWGPTRWGPGSEWGWTYPWAVLFCLSTPPYRGGCHGRVREEDSRLFWGRDLEDTSERSSLQVAIGCGGSGGVTRGLTWHWLSKIHFSWNKMCNFKCVCVCVCVCVYIGSKINTCHQLMADRFYHLAGKINAVSLWCVLLIAGLQPHLAWVRLIRFWVWVGLHTCDAGTIMAPQDKPVITTHTLRREALSWQHVTSAQRITSRHLQ